MSDPGGKADLAVTSTDFRFRPIGPNAWRASLAPAGNAKGRPGITPYGLIRDCWSPSSVAVVISGEERKGSASAGLASGRTAANGTAIGLSAAYPQSEKREYGQSDSGLLRTNSQAAWASDETIFQIPRSRPETRMRSNH